MIATSLPLSGVRVVDFGQYIAGPAVAMILGDLGATVVHIDPPTGPRWHSAANAVLNRNKLMITLDLKQADDLARARALIAEADIVIENFRLGRLAQLGIDFAALRSADPALITVSIPGFASNDSLRRDWRAFESVIAASSGVFTDMGLNRVLMGINPSFSPLPLASAYGTMLAASAAVLALQARERTGLGDAIEVPLAAAVMEGLSYNSIAIDALPDRYITQREREIARRRRENLPMDMDYAALQGLLDPFYRTYRCLDGGMFYVVCPSHRFHAKRCLEVLGLYDDLIAQGLTEEADTYRPAAQWQSDVSLGVYPLPKDWADRITTQMEAVFLTRTAAEWERIFGRGRIPGARQRRLQEWISDDHALMTGLMIELDDPEFGVMIQPGPMAWLEESGERALTPTPRRSVDCDTALTALRALRRDLPPPTAVDDRRGWLTGVKVLDLCNVIAGPHSAAYLARFGAEVIKLDPATPLYDCWNTVIFGMTHMRGKRSVLADIRSAAGREVFERLVKSVDVIVWNAPDNQIAAMGLDADALRALNPDAIFCKLDCFGGPRPGPRSNYLGYDDLVQATTGIMTRFGGSMETPEEHAHVGTIDVMCGFGAALAIAAALYQQARTGIIGRARTSLSALSGLAQMPFSHDYSARKPFDEPAGRTTRGFDALCRIYPTASGEFVMLSALASDLARLEAMPGLQGIADMPMSEREALIAAAFMREPAQIWLKRMRVADIGAALCENIADIRQQCQHAADGTPGTMLGSYAFSIYADHPSGHTVTMLDDLAVRSERAPIIALYPAEKYGASTRSVLIELGYDETEISAMIAAKAVSVSWGAEYLPS